MAPKIPSDHDRELLSHLSSHPSWGVLRTVSKERMDEVFLLTARELMRGEVVPKEVIEYRRGFFAGMKFLLDNPTVEAQKLERSLAAEQGSVTLSE